MNLPADRLRAHVAHDFEGGIINRLLDEALDVERQAGFDENRLAQALHALRPVHGYPKGLVGELCLGEQADAKRIIASYRRVGARIR